MSRTLSREKGIALVIVLATLFIVIILANVVLNIIVSQSRITHHQVSRIQAYYAAMAATNLALERLRIGSGAGGWTYDESAGTNSCPNAAPCTVTDVQLPPSVLSVNVIFCPSGSICSGSPNVCAPPSGNNFCIYSITNYAYTP